MSTRAVKDLRQELTHLCYVLLPMVYAAAATSTDNRSNIDSEVARDIQRSCSLKGIRRYIKAVVILLHRLYPGRSTAWYERASSILTSSWFLEAILHHSDLVCSNSLDLCFFFGLPSTNKLNISIPTVFVMIKPLLPFVFRSMGEKFVQPSITFSPDKEFSFDLWLVTADSIPSTPSETLRLARKPRTRRPVKYTPSAPHWDSTKFPAFAASQKERYPNFADYLTSMLLASLQAGHCVFRMPALGHKVRRYAYSRSTNHRNTLAWVGEPVTCEIVESLVEDELGDLPPSVSSTIKTVLTDRKNHPALLKSSNYNLCDASDAHTRESELHAYVGLFMEKNIKYEKAIKKWMQSLTPLLTCLEKAARQFWPEGFLAEDTTVLMERDTADDTTSLTNKSSPDATSST